MTKKKNTEKEKTELSLIQSKVAEMEQEGMIHAVIIGLDENEFISVKSTLPSYEQIHALLNRGLFQVTIAHNKYILEAYQEKNENSKENTE